MHAGPYCVCLGCKTRRAQRREQGIQCLIYFAGETGTERGNQRARNQHRVMGECLGAEWEDSDEIMRESLPGEAQGSRCPGRGSR